MQFGREYVTEALREKEDMSKVAARIVPKSGKCEVFVPVWDEVVAEVLAKVAMRGKMPVVVLLEAEGVEGAVETAEGPVKMDEFARKMREGYGLFDDEETHELLSQKDFVARLGKSYSSVSRIVLTTAAINCANGGVLAQSRQALASVVAKAAQVPFYVAGESFRSAGIFPLTRRSASATSTINDKIGILEQAQKEGLSFIVSTVEYAKNMALWLILLGKKACRPHRSSIRGQARLQSNTTVRRNHQKLVLRLHCFS